MWLISLRYVSENTQKQAGYTCRIHMEECSLINSTTNNDTVDQGAVIRRIRDMWGDILAFCELKHV